MSTKPKEALVTRPPMSEATKTATELRKRGLLTGADVLIYLTLLSWPGPTHGQHIRDTAHNGKPGLAEQVGYSRRTIVTARQRLAELNLIAFEGGPGRWGTQYRFFDPATVLDELIDNFG